MTAFISRLWNSLAGKFSAKNAEQPSARLSQTFTEEHDDSNPVHRIVADLTDDIEKYRKKILKLRMLFIANAFFAVDYLIWAWATGPLWWYLTPIYSVIGCAFCWRCLRKIVPYRRQLIYLRETCIKFDKATTASAIEMYEDQIQALFAEWKNEK